MGGGGGGGGQIAQRTAEGGAQSCVKNFLRVLFFFAIRKRSRSISMHMHSGHVPRRKED